MKPTIKNNSLHPNTKYVNKNMYMTDNEDNEVIEDSLTKDEKFKKERNIRVKQLIALRAPDVIVEREKYIATLTIAEYKNLLNEEEKEEKILVIYDIGDLTPLIDSFFNEYGEKQRKEIDLWYGE